MIGVVEGKASCRLEEPRVYRPTPLGPAPPPKIPRDCLAISGRIRRVEQRRIQLIDKRVDGLLNNSAATQLDPAIDVKALVKNRCPQTAWTTMDK